MLAPLLLVLRRRRERDLVLRMGRRIRSAPALLRSRSVVGAPVTDQQLLDVLGDWLNGRRDVTPEVADAWVALDALVAREARYRTALEQADTALMQARNGLDLGLGLAREIEQDWDTRPRGQRCREQERFLFQAREAHARVRAALAGADDQETA